MTGGQTTVRFRGLVALGVGACLVLLVWVPGGPQGPSDGTTAKSASTAPPRVSSPSEVVRSDPALATPEAPSPSRAAPDTGASQNPDVLLVVGDAASPNTSERGIRERLRSRGYHVTIAHDDDAAMAPDRNSLVIVSKTVTSTEIGDRFRGTTAGVLTWEDNAQPIEQGGEVDDAGSGAAMLAWIDLVNPEGTSWHARDTIWDVDPGAPAALRAGLSGMVPIYRTTDEMTYAPAGTLPGNAIAVASFGSDDRVTYYVYDRDARLPDGTITAGRRVYFGLYDDTFGSLTDAGLRLFDAAVDWGAGVSG